MAGATAQRGNDGEVIIRRDDEIMRCRSFFRPVELGKNDDYNRAQAGHEGSGRLAKKEKPQDPTEPREGKGAGVELLSASLPRFARLMSHVSPLRRRLI